MFLYFFKPNLVTNGTFLELNRGNQRVHQITNIAIPRFSFAILLKNFIHNLKLLKVSFIALIPIFFPICVSTSFTSSGILRPPSKNFVHKIHARLSSLFNINHIILVIR